MSYSTKEASRYKISSVDERGSKEGDIKVVVQVTSASKIFTKSAKDLYQPEWIEGFSKEDAAYLGVLAASSGKYEPLLTAPKETKLAASSPVVLLGMVFMALLLCSNVGSFKLSAIEVGSFGVFSFVSPLFFFPLLFVINDVITEVYGFRVARRVILSAFIGLLSFIVFLFVIMKLPASPHWYYQNEFELVFGDLFTRKFFASPLAFLSGQLLNSYLLSRWKILTSGKFFGLRAVGSSICGATINSAVFIVIVFYSTLSAGALAKIISLDVAITIAVEAAALPLAYALVRYFKKHKVQNS